jgi:Flp pilus assembly protein TadG
MGDSRGVMLNMPGNLNSDLVRKNRLHLTPTWNSARGQALVEVAFLLPMLLLLTVGVIEVGRFSYVAILVGNAARAGTAYGSRSLGLSADTPGITNAVLNDFQNNGQVRGNLTVTSSNTCGCDNGTTVTPDTVSACSPTGLPPTCATGHWVVTLHVQASGSVNSIFHFPGIPSSLALSRTSTMRVAQN